MRDDNHGRWFINVFSSPEAALQQLLLAPTASLSSNTHDWHQCAVAAAGHYACIQPPLVARFASIVLESAVVIMGKSVSKKYLPTALAGKVLLSVVSVRLPVLAPLSFEPTDF